MSGKVPKGDHKKGFSPLDTTIHNPDNVRKAWDSYRTKTNFVDGTNSILYQLNTGHSETTRNNYYLKPATDEEITKFLYKQLNLIEDPKNCYVADDDPPKTKPEVEDPQEEVDEQIDDGEVENEERCDEDIHGRDAVTADAAEMNRIEDSDNENSASDTLFLANEDSFPDDDDYEPSKKVKKKNTPKEEPIDALGEKAKRWSQIRVKLLNFKGPDDPLRKQLIALFMKFATACATFYMGSSNNWPKPRLPVREKPAFWLKKLSKKCVT